MRPPHSPPQDLEGVGRQILRDPGRASHVFRHAFQPTIRGRYRHWHSLRYCEPPDDLTHEEWWWGIKLARQSAQKRLPLLDRDGVPFTFSVPDPAQEMLSAVDSKASGQIVMPERVTNPATRDRYILNSLIEEAIRSSQLEGAATTRKVAKQMIRTGRRPRDRAERMILNNFRAMQFIARNRDERLTPQFVLDLHRVVTVDTLDNPADAGRLRGAGPDDQVVVHDPAGNWVMHVPPSWESLPDRLERLCAFANGEIPAGEGSFIHPVVRAVLVHFAIGYDHPFVDGNGRTARALFYWAMLSQGYWLSEYVAMSTILRRAPAKYARAFYYTETDDGDTTYFILHHLSVFLRAIDATLAYLSRKVAEYRQTHDLLRESRTFNHRQIALLGHALRHPDAEYTVRSHGTSHQVVPQTARNDLLELAENGLLRKAKLGKAFVFRPVSRLDRRLSEWSDPD